MKEDAERDLAEAKPALDAALAALNSITPKDIGSLKVRHAPWRRFSAHAGRHGSIALGITHLVLPARPLTGHMSPAGGLPPCACTCRR